VTVVATAAEPGAEDLLRNLCQGSRVRKVPRDLAHLSAQRSQVSSWCLRGWVTPYESEDSHCPTLRRREH